MKKNKTPSYILTLKLKTEKYQEDIINKRLEIARNISNALTNKVLKRYNSLLESKEYIHIKKQLNPVNKNYHNSDNIKSKKIFEKQRKELYKQLEELYIKFSLSQYSLYEDVKPMYKHFKDNIGSLEAQAIADRVWSKFDKLLHGNASKVTFSIYNNYNSIENKWNKSGLKYDINSNTVKWNKLIIPVIIKNNDLYAQKAIQNKVKYCRIVRKLIRGKYKYCVQLVMEGIPPVKVNSETGEIKNSIGVGNVGIDIGTRTIAFSSQYDVKLLELCPEVENIERKKSILQRKLDRQRRANNPNNYNYDGTIKRGVKLEWTKSNKYIKTQNELREIQRKQADIRKQSHEKLANYIISLGDRILVETMQFQGLQKRAKKTTKNQQGKFNKKKRFGKSLANKAPAMLIEIIKRKLKYEKLEILKINTQKVKASQYNHFTNEYNKKELKDRWNKDIEIQRDMYSAFLIMNVNDDLESINRDKCIETYNSFKLLHDKEIQRLKELKLQGYKLISSMGI
ncbi:RNA-guided endonuclease TnpB family protein [Clostridium butyricum]|uniref:RNA-guided endonuclease TnpB family protein n=1 Tax=Clostridium butyricum TaxID=1492 RepID=UPI003465694B